MDFSLLGKTPLFDSPHFTALIVKILFDFAVTYIAMKLIYFRIYRNRTYLFTFIAFNLIIFLVCYLLNNLTLGLGFSFGIFAIFSILRYRTLSLPIKEMTYLFISISIAIINSLSNETISYAELFFANFAVLAVLYLLEKRFAGSEQTKYIIYERIDLVKPQRHDEMIKDLKCRTGLEVTRAEVGRIDFLKDVAELKIYFNADGYSHFLSEKDHGCTGD